jgi:glycosyltransferase involved in cell wall biosynthesis
MEQTPKLTKYVTPSGEVVLYAGNPDLSMVDELVKGGGDLWHSSFEQGFKNCFQDLKYQTAVYWWFLNDFDGLEKCISWRLNSNAFVIRERVWNELGGFDTNYESHLMSGLDFGYNLIRNNAGVPIYYKGLFSSKLQENIKIPRNDRYRFFLKNFKKHHAYYMLIRKGIFRMIPEYISLKRAAKKPLKKESKVIAPRALKKISGTPTVSLVIPTMGRQKHTQLLLEDHKRQTYLIKEAVIVDQTPESEREPHFYNNNDFPFEVKVKWKKTRGSCIARNDAINLCTGDFIIFADDDIRVKEDFVENHIRLLQTYNADACNGLDIMAENVHQDLNDLDKRLEDLGDSRWEVGISPMFSNANSCVRSEYVAKLVGNDINFEGGYGEDADFGFSIVKEGGVLLHNPFSPNLHLKPKEGGYRWWGREAKKKGKSRKEQPWELDNPVKNIIPVPSPTITYGALKHYTDEQIKEWRVKHFFIYLFRSGIKKFPLRLLKLPYKQLQFSKSLTYARALINLGIRYK